MPNWLSSHQCSFRSIVIVIAPLSALEGDLEVRIFVKLAIHKDTVTISSGHFLLSAACAGISQKPTTCDPVWNRALRQGV